MPRARKGTLVYRRNSGYNAFVWVTVKGEDGEPKDERQWIPLKTHDKDLAKRKMAKIVAMVASGQLVADAAKKEAKKVETLAEATKAFVAHRKSIKVVMAPEEERWLNFFVEKIGGELPISKVRTHDINRALEEAVTEGYCRETVKKIRGALDRFFNRSWKAEVITENPVKRAEMPEGATVDRRPRVILTDEQIFKFLSGTASGKNGKKPRKDAEVRLLELKVMAVCARYLGGLRTAEVNRFDWTMVLDPNAEVQTFAVAKVTRAKAKRGEEPLKQNFVMPEQVRRILHDWHKAHGCPKEGPIFPVTKGKNKGEQRKERGTSYAARLRRELLRMGIGTKDHPIHKDTATSKRVDFHSFRRAFVTGLADAGVNEQTAMKLAAHSDSRVHAGYNDKLRPMVIPAAALPAIPVLPIAAGRAAAAAFPPGPPTEAPVFQHARSDSNRRHSASKAEDGLVDYADMTRIAPFSWVPAALAVPPCFTVPVVDKQQGCNYSQEGVPATVSDEKASWN